MLFEELFSGYIEIFLELPTLKDTHHLLSREASEPNWLTPTCYSDKTNWKICSRCGDRNIYHNMQAWWLQIRFGISQLRNLTTYTRFASLLARQFEIVSQNL